MSDDLNIPNQGLPIYSGPPAETRLEDAARVVRYGAMRWVGEFTPRAGLDFRNLHQVVVQTDRGIELGELVGPTGHTCTCGKAVPRAAMDTYVANSGPEFCRPRAGRILRGATPQDVNEQQHLNAHIKDDIDHCAEVVAQLRLDMRVVTAEHLLGGERIVFYFTSPARVDFRQLVKELAQRYRTRIEMRQVGARDEARLVADYEVCGREVCCRGFLKKLRPVNMKMAKLQKSTLDPSKVSGRCGRLRCCLRYEHQGYEELAAALPRIGARIQTEYGPGLVEDRQVLTQLVSIRLDDGRTFAFPIEELDLEATPPAAAPPAPAPEAATPRRPASAQPLPAAPEGPADVPRERDQDRGEPGGARRRSRRSRRGRGPRRESDFVPETPPGETPPSPGRARAGDSAAPRGETAGRPPASASQRRRKRRRRFDRRGDGDPGNARQP